MKFFFIAASSLLFFSLSIKADEPTLLRELSRTELAEYFQTDDGRQHLARYKALASNTEGAQLFQELAKLLLEQEPYVTEQGNFNCSTHYSDNKISAALTTMGWYMPSVTSCTLDEEGLIEGNGNFVIRLLDEVTQYHAVLQFVIFARTGLIIEF